MRKRLIFCVTMLALALPLLAASVSAQDRELVVNIPFNFTACREILPAGKYKVRPITSANTNVLLMRSADNRSAEIVCTHDLQGTKPVSTGKLIFNRYGEQYFLAEMWFPGRQTGNQLIKSEKEEALIKELPPVKRERVTVKISETKPN
jgi:hypothetical protein